MDTEKIKALAEELKAKAEEILSACNSDYEEEFEDGAETEDSEESENSEETPSAASGKNLAVLIALKKKMGKK